MEYLTLNNGVKMPLIGFGTFQITDKEECERSIVSAIGAGYRLIDTAQAYGNEEFVGNAIKKCGVARDELFITTKLWFRNYEKADAEKSLDESLKKLQLDYIDMVLLHWPYGNVYEAWRTLESFCEGGKIRAVGISNFDADRMIDLITFNKIRPCINQIETHLFCQRKSESEWLKKYGIADKAQTRNGGTCMDKRKLRDIEVSPIGMGCMGFSHGYGEIPTRDYSIEAIRKAYDFGCTFFDTAESYGPNLLPENRGHNERIVGEAVLDFRKEVVLATKLHLDANEVEENGLENVMRRHLTASLERLQTDYVDLYYLHRINPNIPTENVAEVMGKFIREGVIRGWGLSQVDVDVIDRANEVTPLSAVQNIYSMLERGIGEAVIPYCLEHNIGVVPFSPTASGFLSGKVTADSDFSHSDDVRKFVPQLSRENMEANRPITKLLDRFAKSKNATQAQISLSWMLHKYPNVVPIPGSKNKERILENLGAWDVALTDDEFAKLEAALEKIPVHGHRGFSEQQGGSMTNWGKKQ